MSYTAGLEAYGNVFSPDIIDGLNETAERLGGLSYRSAVREFDIPEPTEYRPDFDRPIEVLDRIPKDGYDKVLAVQCEVTAGIDEHYAIHMVPLYDRLPNYRIITFGRPTSRDNTNNLLLSYQAKQVRKGNITALAMPTLDYLRFNRLARVDEAVHYGFSLGGDIVPEIPKHSAGFEHNPTAVISIDGVTGTARSPLKLARDFLHSASSWQAYLKEIENPAFQEARKLARNGGVLKVASAFSTESTLSICLSLAKGGMEDRLRGSLVLNPDLVAVVLNLGASELSRNDDMDNLRANLRKEFGGRVFGGTVEGLKHGVNDQIYANAGLLLHGLQLASGLEL